MSARTAHPADPVPAQYIDAGNGGGDIQRLCDLAAERAGVIRGVAPALLACAGFDPALNCCVFYFRLAKDEEDCSDEHRDVVVAELDRWQFSLLASGSAERIAGEDPAYCLLVEATWDDVPDLRAAMLKTVRAWEHGWHLDDAGAGSAG